MMTANRDHMSGGFLRQPANGALASARRGEAVGREALYRCYARPVFNLARRMLGEQAAAEDVLQDSFLDVFEKLSDYRGDAPLGMWIRRIAVNRCLMHLRQHWNARRDSLDDHPEPVGRQTATDGHDLTSLLDRLPPEDRAVMWLKEVEGYSHAEIAELHGQSVSYSKSRLSRAYQRLRHMAAKDVETCMQTPAS
jgi:RNA polymerase sigma factor (sigma-70 family)